MATDVMTTQGDWESAPQPASAADMFIDLNVPNDIMTGLDSYFPQLGSRTTIKQYERVRNRNLLGHNDNIRFLQ